MSIPNYLYDFEGNLEPAFYAVLKSAGIPYPKMARGSEDIETPCVTVEIKIGEELRRFPCIASNGDQVLLPDYYRASATIDMMTNRLKPEQYALHAIWRSAIRITMIDWERSFAGKLQYHAIDEIREGGSSPAIDNGDKLDTSSISFNFTFHILTEAFPNPI